MYYFLNERIKQKTIIEMKNMIIKQTNSMKLCQKYLREAVKNGMINYFRI